MYYITVRDAEAYGSITAQNHISSPVSSYCNHIYTKEQRFFLSFGDKSQNEQIERCWFQGGVHKAFLVLCKIFLEIKRKLYQNWSMFLSNKFQFLLIEKNPEIIIFLNLITTKIWEILIANKKIDSRLSRVTSTEFYQKSGHKVPFHFISRINQKFSEKGKIIQKSSLTFIFFDLVSSCLFIL